MAGPFEGKRGLVLGRRQQALDRVGDRAAARRRRRELAFTYQGERIEKSVRELADSVDSPLVTECDVRSDEDVARVFGEVADAFGGELDLLVHSVAFAAAEDLEGRFTDTPRDRFWMAVDVSAYSLVACARAAEPLMEKAGGGSILTMTYLGGERAVPHYNVMGVAKATLDSCVRYLAWDLGEKNIRVNAVSAGPVRTLAARSIAGFTTMEDDRRGALTAPPPHHRRRRRRCGRVPPRRRRTQRDRHDAVRRLRLPRDGHVARGAAVDLRSPVFRPLQTSRNASDAHSSCVVSRVGWCRWIAIVTTAGWLPVAGRAWCPGDDRHAGRATARVEQKDGVRGCAGERLRSRSHEEHGIRDRRQGGRPRLGRGLRRPGRGWGCRARAGGRGWDRQVDALARGRRGRALARAPRPLVATGGGRARPRSRGARRPVRGCPRGRRRLDLDAEATRARDRAPTRGGHRRSC